MPLNLISISEPAVIANVFTAVTGVVIISAILKVAERKIPWSWVDKLARIAAVKVK